jgi:hypothetical protein
MTLIFARDRSVEGVREALFAGRTAIYYYLPGERDLLIGMKSGCLPFSTDVLAILPSRPELGLMR